jgi:hypothetical protein
MWKKLEMMKNGVESVMMYGVVLGHEWTRPYLDGQTFLPPSRNFQVS